MTEKQRSDNKDWRYRCHPTEDDLIGYWVKTKLQDTPVVLVIYLPHPDERDDSVDTFLKTLANKKKPYSKEEIQNNKNMNHVFIPMAGWQAATSYQKHLEEKGFFSKIFVQGEVAN